MPEPAALPRPFVVLERTRCCGNLECVAIAPDVFAQDAEGYGTVTTPSPSEAQMARVREAAESCPAQAIRLEER